MSKNIWSLPLHLFSMLFLVTVSLSIYAGPPRAESLYEAISGHYYYSYNLPEKNETWSKQFLEMNNKNKLDEKGDCHVMGVGEKIIVLQIELDGTVSYVFTADKQPKSLCHAKSYLGVRLPPPPVAPYYHLLLML